jgi:prevent-host-death family protein
VASKLLSVRKRIPKKVAKAKANKTAAKTNAPSIVSAYEAKTHFSALLERASKGESITITKYGQEVAKLSPVKTLMTREEAVEKLQVFGKGKNLGKGVTIRDLIEEGRR